MSPAILVKHTDVCVTFSYLYLNYQSSLIPCNCDGRKHINQLFFVFHLLSNITEQMKNEKLMAFIILLFLSSQLAKKLLCNIRFVVGHSRTFSLGHSITRHCSSFYGAYWCFKCLSKDMTRLVVLASFKVNHQQSRSARLRSFKKIFPSAKWLKSALPETINQICKKV